jgi:hypothetical protein
LTCYGPRCYLSCCTLSSSKASYIHAYTVFTFIYVNFLAWSLVTSSLWGCQLFCWNIAIEPLLIYFVLVALVGWSRCVSCSVNVESSSVQSMVVGKARHLLMFIMLIILWYSLWFLVQMTLFLHFGSWYVVHFAPLPSSLVCPKIGSLSSCRPFYWQLYCEVLGCCEYTLRIYSKCTYVVEFK